MMSAAYAAGVITAVDLDANSLGGFVGIISVDNEHNVIDRDKVFSSIAPITLRFTVGRDQGANNTYPFDLVRAPTVGGNPVPIPIPIPIPIAGWLFVSGLLAVGRFAKRGNNAVVRVQAASQERNGGQIIVFARAGEKADLTTLL